MNEHDIVSKLKALAVELGRIPTRDEFVKVVPKRTYLPTFGSFSAVVQAAGLRTKEKSSPEERKYEREVQKHNTIETYQDVYERGVLPYIEKYRTADDKRTLLAVSSDHHSFWLDPFAWNVFLDTCKRTQPGIITLAGDVLDFYAISKYDQDPRRLLSLEAELRFVKERIFTPLREACPKSQIDFLLGNHEIRLWKHLVNQAPALSGLNALKFGELLELDKFRISLVARPSILVSKVKEQHNYIVYGDTFAVTHGTLTGQAHAKAELAKFNMSGCSGHVHHHQVQTRVILGEDKKPKNLMWTSLGCMASDKVGDYMWDFPRQNTGFALVHIYNGESVTDYVPVEKRFTVSAGKYYFK